ncbi:cysteine dioxygenase [Cytobacillus firmus]|uniref:Cysteine dioxygenase n=2 Tax=Cytobacillus TaxID=2675230 RepID=A0A366JYN1_CYTFI|nr:MULTISPECIES: cysteine dioxygenase family protein [Cytobacillus]RBP94629.1 cysteine dioxygenase [Cytobacillus firmus]TDX43375.1 cysteine dioxygenase [Cytobacillus oceanisediminis]
MALKERFKNSLDSLKSPSAEELRKALASLDIKLGDLLPHLQPADGKPYYRKLLYQNDEVELLLMNWSEVECAPHDHGNSKGWIQVLNGDSENTVFEVKEDVPVELFTEIKSKDSFFFAPKKGVHKMKSAGREHLVTLHLYSPPITGMKVYDLQRCAACVVSEDCGAWWPEELRQKVKEIQLK